LKNGKPSSPAALFIGYSALNIAFKGGVLVPTPDLTVPFTTDGSGGYTYPITWPSVATIGATAWFQFWVKEQNSPEVWASSNAMKAVTVTL
ncbi:MAG TPA: hypothetical protein VK824_04505, partial [Planctomycetota bacterium]|nr:hypothetical protein [Planctomycetota bacterium]